MNLYYKLAGAGFILDCGSILTVESCNFRSIIALGQEMLECTEILSFGDSTTSDNNCRSTESCGIYQNFVQDGIASWYDLALFGLTISFNVGGYTSKEIKYS